MGTIRVGHDYRLDIDNELWDLPTPWGNKSSKLKRFKTWNQLDGKIVRVKSKTKIIAEYSHVFLLENPEEIFQIPNKCLLEVTRRLPIMCSCKMRTLLITGCKCGAFRKEQSIKIS